MSETKLTITELQSWLQKETGSVLTPVQAKAQEQRDQTRNALQNLSEASKMLLENSQKEIEKRNMKVYNRARALNKLASLFIERIRKLKIPEQVSYDSLSVFSGETQKAIVVTEIDIRNWFPKISPFFIMDRRKFLTVYEKTKIYANSLNDFVNKEYVKSKTLEKTFQIISEVQTLERQVADIEAAKENLQSERLLLDKEICELQQQTEHVKSKAALEEVTCLEAETEVLNNELKQLLNHLQKPFLKMQALATSGGGGGITPDELKMIGLYMENPFEAVITEQAGCPTLKDILEKLTGFLAEDKLKLKPDKQRKAEQAISEILKSDSLAINAKQERRGCKSQETAFSFTRNGGSKTEPRTVSSANGNPQSSQRQHRNRRATQRKPAPRTLGANRHFQENDRDECSEFHGQTNPSPIVQEAYALDFSKIIKESEAVQAEDFSELIDQTIEALRVEPASENISVTEKLVNLKPVGEALVIGDLHGDLTSLGVILEQSNFLQKMDADKRRTIIFLGDYGDRGVQSPELYYAIMSLKLAYPDQVVLLRGNHEGPGDLMATPHDLPIFLERKFKEKWVKVYQHLSELFNFLYNAVYVEERYLMVHGGLPSKIRSLQDIADATKLYPQKTFLEELLWNDPDEQVRGVSPSPRGAGNIFGKTVTQEVLQKLGAKILIRGHESAGNGYKINHGGKVLTLFSRKGPPYFNRYGAYLEVPLAEKFENANQLVPYIHKF